MLFFVFLKSTYSDLSRLNSRPLARKDVSTWEVAQISFHPLHQSDCDHVTHKKQQKSDDIQVFSGKNVEKSLLVVCVVQSRAYGSRGVPKPCPHVSGRLSARMGG
ncbi:hypothetical protein FQA47_001179 [Oryzias melastigma]|uniref:Uncharacterized protein n=1 Tax=Oryzias melastigma TaxID=30732 RepID=A0A834C6R2_ORYME|nr:hypothetical protein FQA47_001179 [Oryzias melastigma]